MIIYKATNKINGKRYIGRTIKSLNTRISSHLGDALANKYNIHFHSALRKYGADGFDWDIIAECDDIDELNRLEIFFIGQYDTYNSGYNMTLGGEGISGWNHTEESNKKNSESHKGEKSSWWGKRHSEETKKKLSKGKKGENNPNYNKHPTKETREKMSKANKGEKNSMYGKRGSESPAAKKYTITTPQGKEIFVHGLSKFCRDYKKEKLNHGSLVSVARGRRNHNKGYLCRYEN